MTELQIWPDQLRALPSVSKTSNLSTLRSLRGTQSQSVFAKLLSPVLTQQKTHNLFWPDENRIEQCCAAHIVQGCQQY